MWVPYEPEPQGRGERAYSWILQNGFLVTSVLVGLLVVLALYAVPGPPEALNTEALSASSESPPAAAAQGSGASDAGSASPDTAAFSGKQRRRGGDGSLWVTSWPAEATVFVNEEPIGQTPLRRHALAAGTYRLSVQKRGHPSVDTVVVVRREGAKVLRLALPPRPSASDPSLAAASEPEAAEPGAARSKAESAAAAAEQARGVLRIASEPAGATVWLDGRTVGETPLRVVDVPVGAHTVVLRRGGYEPRERKVAVRSGAGVQTVSEQLAPQQGTLSVLVQPWGHVYVDGALRKREADARYAVKLPAGAHRVTVVHPELGTWEKTVRIEPYRTNSVAVNFNEDVREAAAPTAQQRGGGAASGAAATAVSAEQ